VGRRCIEAGCPNEGTHKILTLDGQIFYVCDKHLDLWIKSGCATAEPMTRFIKKFLISPALAFRNVRDESWRKSYFYFAKFLIIFSILTTISWTVIISVITNYLLSLVNYLMDFSISFFTPLGVPAEAIERGRAMFLNMFLNLNEYIVYIALGLLVFTIVFGLIGILVSSGWTYIWVRLCGGKKSVKETIKAMAYGSTPSLLIGWIPIIGGIFWIWSIIVSIIGIRELHGISTKRTILAFLLSTLTFLPLILIFLILIIILTIFPMFV